MAIETLTATNSPNISYWHRDHGYSNEMHESTFPNRIFNTRVDGGLSVYPQLLEKDIEYVCSGPTHGYKVILSTPGESLSGSRDVFQIPAMQQTSAFIRPKMIQTDDNLRDHAPNVRHCFYSTERSLKYFRFYARSNCKSECLANFTLRECGCVKFSMPSKCLWINLLAFKRSAEGFSLQGINSPGFVVQNVLDVVKTPKIDCSEKM